MTAERLDALFHAVDLAKAVIAGGTVHEVTEEDVLTTAEKFYKFLVKA